MLPFASNVILDALVVNHRAPDDSFQRNSRLFTRSPRAGSVRHDLSEINGKVRYLSLLAWEANPVLALNHIRFAPFFYAHTNQPVKTAERYCLEIMSHACFAIITNKNHAVCDTAR
jgi:hypothetical protein